MFSEISSSGSRRTPSSNASVEVRRFLETFKTEECPRNKDCPAPTDCNYFHHQADMRRSPFHKNSLLYRPELCLEQTQLKQNCGCCHNQYELDYHPLNYLTTKCSDYYSCQQKFCPCYHENQLESIGSNFFRFDLATFKTKKCTFDYSHDLKTCLFFHNGKDRRRPHLNYQHMMCDNKGECTNGDACYRAHNKIEQLYHPSRYKSKFCQKYPDQLIDCQYGEFCSFAHNNREIAIDLIHEKQQTMDFLINEYKTVWCPYTNDHDRKICVYAHNVQDFRRSPKIYSYEPERCLSWNTKKTLKSPDMGGCSKGMACTKCHGWKEFDYHPANLTRNRQQHTKTYGRKTIYDPPDYQKDELMRKVHEKVPCINRVHTKVHEPVIVSTNPMVGAPFFQHEHERDLSVTAKVSKPYFKASSSDVEAHDKNKGKRKESIGSFEQKPERKCLNNMFMWKKYEGDEKQFACFSQKSEQDPMSKQRTRSCNKHSYVLSYSKSFEDLFMGTHIVQKLKNQRLSQIKVMNMTTEDVQEQLKSLSQQQRKLLLERLHDYNSKSSMLSYSSQLMQFFRRNNRQHILQKMRKKRVKQDKLLHLISHEIHSLSFIEEEDKLLLPQLLREFNNNKEFGDLNSEISKVSGSTSEINQLAPATT